MLGKVSAWVGDRLWTGKPYRRRTRHPGLLSLRPPSMAGWNEYPAKAGEENRHIAWYTSPYPWSCSVVLMPGRLVEISTDLRHLEAHWMMRYTNPHYFTYLLYFHFHNAVGWLVTFMNCGEMVHRRLVVTTNTNRKPYPRNAMVPYSTSSMIPNPHSWNSGIFPCVTTLARYRRHDHQV